MPGIFDVQATSQSWRAYKTQKTTWTIHGHTPRTLGLRTKSGVDLGVEQSHSRPHTSNDNPYSESHFTYLDWYKAVNSKPFECSELFGSATNCVDILAKQQQFG